jgi:hypothetical protein
VGSELERLLDQGRMVLLFDGMDEMPRRDFERRLDAIREFTRARAQTTMVFAYHPRIQEVFAAYALRAMDPGPREEWLSARVDDPWRHELFVLLARPDVDLSLFLSRQLDTLEQVLAPSASVPVRDTSVLGAFTFEIRLALLGRLIESAALPATDENVVRMGPLSRPPHRTQANTSTAKVLLEQPRESPLAPSSPSSAPASPQPGAPCSPPPPPLGGAGRLMAHPHNTCYGVT